MSFAVFGLGRFGRGVAEQLTALGREVVAVDLRHEAVAEVKDRLSQAVVGDATKGSFLEALGLDQVTGAVVSVGTRIDQAALITMNLRELGVKRIVAKASSPEHETVLRLTGASEVVFPEREVALRVATRLATPGFLESLSLEGSGLAVVKVDAPEVLWGSTLAQAGFRATHRASVVAILRPGKPPNTNPGAEDQLEEGDTLVLVGDSQDMVIPRQG